MKREKSTALEFGGLIDVYSIIDAVEEIRLQFLYCMKEDTTLQVNEKPLDTFFDRESEPVTPYFHDLL